jgi:hypothetical protein
MCSILQFSGKYGLSILTGLVLCATGFNSGCSSYSKRQNAHPNAAEGAVAAVMKDHDHPNMDKDTGAAVREMVAVVEKSLADLPVPPSAPAVCCDELTKLREVLKAAPGTGNAADAHSALLLCISKATNETNCKGKSQPCGVVYYTPPIKGADAGLAEPGPSAPRAVDVSAPDQIAAACREIAAAGRMSLSTSDAGDPARGVILGSLIGRYSCGAWFKAAANNDPIIFISPVFAPTVSLLRDLKTYTTGVVDVTPEAELANSIKRVDRTLVTIPIGGTFVPVGVWSLVPIGGTPSHVLDGAHETARQRVNQVGKAVEDGCQAADICH